jgi:hypothetical protein
MGAPTTDGLDAYVTFLGAKDGGRQQPAINGPQYRPHLVVGDPCQRKAVTDDANNSVEDYFGVYFAGDGEVLEPGPAHLVRLVPLYAPEIEYGKLVPGTTFTVREGHRVVAFGVVAPPRIYADFNGAEASHRAPNRAAIHLHRMGSLRDLARLGIVLSEGMRLTIYMDSDDTEDIEADAEVYFDSATRHWMAEYTPDEIRDVPRHPGWSGPSFPCVSCRADLAAHIEAHGLELGDVCPECAKPIHRPILPV